MTEEEFKALINEAYWKGFEDAGRTIIDVATSKSKREEHATRDSVGS